MGELIPIRTARLERLHGHGHRLERDAAAGELVRVRRGAYVRRAEADAASPDALHLARILAARLAARHEPVFSHESAAALHGIPLLGPWPEQVCTTSAARAPSTSAVQRSARRLTTADIVELPDGARATDRVRTAIDLAATRSLLAGIVGISHVRGAGADLEAFEAALARAGRFPGLRRVRLALERSTAGSRSVLETLVVVRCQDYGFQPPELHTARLGADDRRHVVDFAWEGGSILGEADPRDAFDRDGGEPPPSAAIEASRRREAALAPVSRAFIRIGWGEAWGGQGLARRLLDAGVPRPERRLVALTS